MVFFAPTRGEGACLRMKLTKRKVGSEKEFPDNQIGALGSHFPEMGITPVLLSSMS